MLTPNKENCSGFFYYRIACSDEEQVLQELYFP